MVKTLAKKPNCWEFKNCGRESGGRNVAELGVCPVATDTTFDGIFGGRNGGRACWVVAGTFCKGQVQGTFAQKYRNCGTCEFFLSLKEAEGESFQPISILLDYIDRSHEQRVDERTLELRQAKEALEAAQRMAQVDLEMASRVQASFLPKELPDSGGWDVAFAYHPLAGVSGDFFDFYRKGGGLAGVSLFDVSGHGVASGLLTLLARTIIRNHFRTGTSKSLGSVLSGANRELVQELSVTDNYLTGLVLRLDGHRVEYVNAGHTDLLVRQASSGRVRRALVPHRDRKGPFLGIAELEAPYEALRFRVDTEDLLLAYTDAFSETRNPQGKEFGVRRIVRSLASLDLREPVQSCLERLVKDFQAFVDGNPLRDDLTIVLLKRKNPAQDWPGFMI